MKTVSDSIYEGFWGVLAGWFQVPRDSPAPPPGSSGGVRSFKPDPGFLRYLKLWFWAGIAFWTVLLVATWAGITVASPTAALISSPFGLLLDVVPFAFGYLTIRLRYDTTWYVMTDRSLRIRRGVWVIRETTITFENIQNIAVKQGPVQRLFGIADLLVETAGGRPQHGEGQQSQTAHQGLLEGIADPHAVRELILSHLHGAQDAGLGDDEGEAFDRHEKPGWTTEHVALLEDIRRSLQTIVSGS